MAFKNTAGMVAMETQRALHPIKIQPVVCKLFFALNLTAFGKDTAMRCDTHN